jgi:aminopeptidase N
MYNKGNNILHMVRTIIDNDSVFRNILRGLNEAFYHKTVDSRDVENYIIKKSGKDLSKLFDQYLRTTQIPTLEYKIQGDKVSYRWTNCINGFNMPVKLANSDQWINPGSDWKEVRLTAAMKNNFQVDNNFYIALRKV